MSWDERHQATTVTWPHEMAELYCKAPGEVEFKATEVLGRLNHVLHG